VCHLQPLTQPIACVLPTLPDATAGWLHVKVLAPGAARLLRTLRQQRLQAGIRNSGTGRRPAVGAGAGAAGGGVGSTAAAAGSRTDGVSAAAAAAAAQQRMQAAQQRGVPVRRDQQQSQRLGGEDGGEGAVRQPVSAEELRLRRLQRFA
jgi:hypothetical protein